MVKEAKLAWGLAGVLVAAACSNDHKPTDAGPGGGGDAAVAKPDGSAPPLDGSIKPDGSLPMGDASAGDSGTDSGGPVITTCDPSKKPVIPALKLEAVPGVGTVNKLVDAEQPKASTDWYLVQQTGTVRILRDGALVAGNFIDVSSEITLFNDADERGLLGIAFPPDYATTGKLYIALTATKGAGADEDTVYEYQRAQDGLTATRTGKIVVQLDASQANHNGGNLQFGPDGFLYFGTGDGGGACNTDKRGTPQDLSSQFGKILRLDPNAAAPYAAAGNPYSGATGDATVLHYGLRNPFRFNFDRATGDLYIGDVGQDRAEEVSYAKAGAQGLNFGWPRFEGTLEGTCLGSVGLRADSTHTPPIVHLPQDTGIYGDYVSVIGGSVYRGAAIPQLQGVYLFGDYTGLRMGAVYNCADGTSESVPIRKNKDPNQPNAAGFTRPSGAAPFNELTAIVEDNAGELYFVVNRSLLWKVVPGT